MRPNELDSARGLMRQRYPKETQWDTEGLSEAESAWGPMSQRETQKRPHSFVYLLASFIPASFGLIPSYLFLSNEAWRKEALWKRLKEAERGTKERDRKKLKSQTQTCHKSLTSSYLIDMCVQCVSADQMLVPKFCSEGNETGHNRLNGICPNHLWVHIQLPTTVQTFSERKKIKRLTKII